MYLCIAIITDTNVQNLGRKIVLDMTEKYKINTIPSRMPQHISLKISFKVEHVNEIEAYFDKFVKDIKPFRINFSGLDLYHIKNELFNRQILWYEVEESQELRKLHDKLNEELSEQFDIKMQEYDGNNFKFHSTIAYDTNKEETFEEIFSKHKGSQVPESFIVSQLALLYSPDEEPKGDNFITYKISNLI